MKFASIFSAEDEAIQAASILMMGKYIPPKRRQIFTKLHGIKSENLHS
jgi:hypothetical protein